MRSSEPTTTRPQTLPPSGEPARSRALLSTALATLTASLVLLPLLGHKPLTEWDEGIYAEISREMLSGAWLVPHLNQVAWLEKPPLMLWITAAFFKLFGVSELWARAGSALSGIATVALLHGWLARTKDTLTAWLSTLILLATFGFLHVCRVGEMDVLLSLGCMIALIGLTQVHERDLRGWIPFWIGFAIALMTKGAASFVLPLTALIFAALERWRTDRLGTACWLGLTLFLLLTVPWHLAMFHRFGDQFVSEYFGLHVLTRATEQIEGHTTPWWYYFKVLLVSAPPFVLLFPFAIVDSLRRARLRAWAVFSLVVIGCFTLVQTRLPHYIAPAYPALAVLTAAYVAGRLRPYILERRSGYFWIKLTAAATVISVAAVLVTSAPRRSLHSATLGNGTVLPDNKDAVALLRDVFQHPPPIAGPLLVLRTGPMFVATDAFYARRSVQQVLLLPAPSGTEADPYAPNPEPLGEAVTSEPRLILLDKNLVPQIPQGLLYTPIRSGTNVELGSIVRAP